MSRQQQPRHPVPEIRFRRRPVEIEAIRFDGSNFAEIIAFAGGPQRAAAARTKLAGACGGIHDGIAIRTVHGTMAAALGDWIVRGIRGELYSCPDDIFRETHQPADGQAPAVDRAAVLREAADAIEEAQHHLDEAASSQLGFLDSRTEQHHVAVHRSGALLRRMAGQGQR